MLGFYNKERNSVRLVKVDRTYNFVKIIKQEVQNDLIGLNQNATGLEHKEIIVGEIGTKKSRKILNQMKNKVIDEGRIQSAVEIKQIIKMQAHTLKDEFEEEKAKEFEKEWNRKKAFLPDFNLSAKSAAKIYNIKSIISEEESAEIKEEFIDDPTYLHNYTIEVYGTIVWDKLTQKSQIEKKKQLMYLNYLLRMRRVKKVEKNLEELSFSLGIPLRILANITEKFYEPVKGDKEDSTKLVRPKPLDVKMICYIFILNLIIKSYKMDVKPLMKVLKLDEQK